MKRLSLLLLLAFASASCASDPAQRDAERLALYRAHAGAPVDSIRYFGRLDGWTPLGSDALALWTRPGEAWLVSLQGSCPDLPYAHAITVSDSIHRIHARFDRILPLVHSPGARIPCFIREIRPVDVKALRAAERDKRKAQTAARDQVSGGT
ncbi:MAG TPA: DUF6491 family protein [Lysobacter sp.]|nr:DUF6491 family protein [Lysobacter sp.]